MQAGSAVETVRTEQTDDPPAWRESGEDPRSSGSSAEEDDNEVPLGQTYPLNSKRVKMTHLQRIAESLKLPTTGTAAVTRQLIEEKLLELGREPRNAQVVIQDTSENAHNAAIFLIDENGVISEYKSREPVMHVSQPVDTGEENPSDELSSALRVKDSELAELRRALEVQNQELSEIREALHQTQETLLNKEQKVRQQSDELNEARAALDKEKRKVKRIWREKCELQLSHEEEIETKDLEIARLRAHTPTAPPTLHPTANSRQL